MEQPTIAYTFLFVEKEEEVSLLPLHHPAHEQTPLCLTLEQKILWVSVCACVCVCVWYEGTLLEHIAGVQIPNSILL